MAEDRLDEAIDAVVRAVDRIERATRGIFEPAAPPAAPSGPVVPDQPAPPPHDLAGSPHLAGFGEAPTTSSAAPSFDPQDFQPAPAPEPQWQPHAPEPLSHEPHWQPHASEPPAPPVAEAAPYDVAPAGPAPSALPQTDPIDHPSVHELVGRIVGTTQQLEDHLDAARRLRAELVDLVSRLAAEANPSA